MRGFQPYAKPTKAEHDYIRRILNYGFRIYKFMDHAGNGVNHAG